MLTSSLRTLDVSTLRTLTHISFQAGTTGGELILAGPSETVGSTPTSHFNGIWEMCKGIDLPM